MTSWTDVHSESASADSGSEEKYGRVLGKRKWRARRLLVTVPCRVIWMTRAGWSRQGGRQEAIGPCISSEPVQPASVFVPGLADSEDPPMLTFWTDDQTTTFGRAAVDRLDDIDQFLLVLDGPITASAVWRSEHTGISARSGAGSKSTKGTLTFCCCYQFPSRS